MVAFWDELVATLPQLVFISLSKPFDESQEVLRLRIKPVMLKKGLFYQLEEFTKTQSFAKNYAPDKFVAELLEKAKKFSQGVVRFTDCEVHLIISPDGCVTSKTKPAAAEIQLQHNRQKPYLLSEGVPVDFLIALGIQNKEGGWRAKSMISLSR